MDLSRYATLFLAEGREHLHTCNRLLLELERSPQASEPIVGVFRSMHTLKGMAASMGYQRLAELAHSAESLLALIRERVASAQPETIDLLFQAVDALESGMDEAVAGRDERLDFAELVSPHRAADQYHPLPDRRNARRPGGAGD